MAAALRAVDYEIHRHVRRRREPCDHERPQHVAIVGVAWIHSYRRFCGRAWGHQRRGDQDQRREDRCCWPTLHM